MQHYLYSIEFLVQKLKVTKPNECAPTYYPVFAEFRFRRSLYTSIHQSQFGSYIDVTEDENGKRDSVLSNERKNGDHDRGVERKKGRCCVFVLDHPVDSSDLLDIRCYKKSSEKCKFMIGMADLPLKKHFDEVMEKYFQANSANSSKRALGLPRPPHDGGQGRSPSTPYPPDFDKDQPYGATEAEIEERKTKKTPGGNDQATFATDTNANEFGIYTEKNPWIPDKPVTVVVKASIPLKNANGEGTGIMVLLFRLGCMGRCVCNEIPYPEKLLKKEACKRAAKDGDSSSARFSRKSSNLRDTCESLNVSSSVGSTAECESEESLPVIKPKVDRAAYEEFEADLNGCGLAIRVLKNSHKVSGVKRYEDPTLCNNSIPAACQNQPNQKSAVVKLLSLICNVLQSVSSEQQPEREYLRNNCLQETNNNINKPPNMQQLCQCIQGMLGANEKPVLTKQTNCKSQSQYCGKRRGQENDCKHGKNGGRRYNGQKRQRGGCECDSQRNIMLFLESIRQVVSHKKGLSDLADLLLQCTCGNANDGGGDRKCGVTAIFRMILEKIKECADDNRPVEQKQRDLCGLVRALTEIQNNDRCCRQRGGQQSSNCDELTRRSSVQTSDSISCLVKKILELGVRYCSNRNIDLRNILMKILADDTCNEELTNICRTIGQYLESDRNVVCDHMRKEANSRGVVNAPCLPIVRGNIKYPSGYDYGSASFTLPTAESECGDDGNIEPYRKKNKLRECCVQIDGPDIDNKMQGINQKLPNGIEICRKGTMDLESDVFILKMGKKVASSDKKGLIEIELRTPKGPNTRRPQLTSVTTQVDEDMLKERVTSSGGGPAGQNGKKGGKKGKGKKGKK